MGGRDGMCLWLRVGKRQGIFFEAESVLSEVVVFGQRRAWARGCAVVAKSWVVVVETGGSLDWGCGGVGAGCV